MYKRFTGRYVRLTQAQLLLYHPKRQMKELLARQVLMDGLRQRSDKTAIEKAETTVVKSTPSINGKDKETVVATPSPRFARKLEDLALAVPPPKRVKVRKKKEAARRRASTPVAMCDTISAPRSECPAPLLPSLRTVICQTSPTSTATNFLGIGASQAKAAKSARRAALVGLDRSKKVKLAHTGSGLRLSQVVRLKYVKGFTQAVRTPCRLQDLE